MSCTETIIGIALLTDCPLLAYRWFGILLRNGDKSAKWNIVHLVEAVLPGQLNRTSITFGIVLASSRLCSWPLVVFCNKKVNIIIIMWKSV
jgi:hypothetical protein